jgi:methyl-accepting chemotaxis protein
MGRTWTFSGKLGLGLGVMAIFTLLLAMVAVFALRHVSAAKDEVIGKHARQMIDAQKLERISVERMNNVRGYVLTRDATARETVNLMSEQYFQLLKDMQTRAATAEELQALDQLRIAATNQFAGGDTVLAMREKEGADIAAAGRVFQDRVVPLASILRKNLAQFVELEQRNLEAATARASDAASKATALMVMVAITGVAAAAILASVLTRVLGRQIGTAVQRLQSSSSELQAAANQQTTGAKEQVASMTEISTTMRELMATARQIAESSQGVVRVADSSTEAAQRGDQTVQRAQNEVAAIRQQVDLVVGHMLDLGRKSQQIGGVLEIINELAEQTSILAINATIEAVGAGEAGKRFSAVADEIRKLAARVGGSTKEIRGLIDQIRAAVNTAVMATESGSKAVDAGTRQFGEVAAVFRQISDLLRNTTEAAREIELSTRQQSTAVEQTNVAVANVATSAREAEASSSQVLQTVAELTTLSRELSRLIQPQAQT